MSIFLKDVKQKVGVNGHQRRKILYPTDTHAKACPIQHIHTGSRKGGRD